MVYKFRHEILDWANRKPTTVRSGILRDLDVLKRYKVDDAIEKIVEVEKDWAESQSKLEKELRTMKEAIKKSEEPKIIRKED
jgi:hypothetical protein